MPAQVHSADPSPATRLAALLAACDGELDEASLAEARSIGPDAASAVVAALLEAEIASPSDDPAPLSAVYLAADLRLAGAAPALASCVLRVDEEDELWKAAMVAIRDIGPPAVDPLLAAFDACLDVEGRARVADALLETGAADDRLLGAFLELLDDDPVEGADRLARYRDPRALPALAEALDRAELDDPAAGRDFLANEDVLVLATAIETVGGTLTAAQRAKARRVRHRRQRLLAEAIRLGTDEIGLAQAPVRRQSRPGRNDPCHCGSGRKYKKCHLEADQRDRGA